MLLPVREQVERADREVAAWESLEAIRKEAATRAAERYGGQRVVQLEQLLGNPETTSGTG